jgi:hydrogenase expression/formation protein HypE
VTASTTRSLAEGPACPASLTDDRVQLGHGSGGKLSAQLVRDLFLPHLGNEVLGQLGDAAVVPLAGVELAVSTDTFVVSPIEFPGGNIGSLAVHGTVNDLAMQGAIPRYLTAGFVLEEGLLLATLDRVVSAMAAAAREVRVPIVAGDTKVVERGRADGLYLNTTGIGSLEPGFRPAPDRVRPGDVLLASGAIARHGMAIMAAREGLAFRSSITSDSACLSPLVERLRAAARIGVHALRDPTRGGVASAVNELATASGVGVEMDESAILVPGDVRAACEVLGLDPLYVANEGVLVAFVAPEAADAALEALRAHPLGRDARVIGRATIDHPRLVVLRTALGGSRVVDLLPGDQLPRIC